LRVKNESFLLGRKYFNFEKYLHPAGLVLWGKARPALAESISSSP